jgi:HD-GYP domain-containing protein (c-di-GMP phosphodiesterase class II)
MIKQIEFISQGNFERKITIQTNDEFKRLSESCNRMMEHIHGLIDEKKQAAEELRKKNQEIIRQRDEINALYQQTAAMNEELTYLLEESKRNYLHTVRALVNAIEAKDYYTGGHCERVMEYAILIGSAMHLNKKELIDLKFAALLHDVGKIGISSAIINKEGKLTQEEMEIIKKHPKIGYNILKDIQFLEDGLDGILHHHERIDGEGYPDGLTGDEIGLIAKILGVADAYDAMTSSRSYRKIPLTKQKAIEQLIQNKNTQFDTEVVDVFVMSLNKGQVDLNLIEYTG